MNVVLSVVENCKPNGRGLALGAGDAAELGAGEEFDEMGGAGAGACPKATPAAAAHAAPSIGKAQSPRRVNDRFTTSAPQQRRYDPD